MYVCMYNTLYVLMDIYYTSTSTHIHTYMHLVADTSCEEGASLRRRSHRHTRAAHPGHDKPLRYSQAYLRLGSQEAGRGITLHFLNDLHQK